MFKVQKDKKKKSILRMRGRGDMASSMTSLVQPYTRRVRYVREVTWFWTLVNLTVTLGLEVIVLAA